MKVREVIAYKNYFEEFLLIQPIKVQDKIYKIIEAIETLERVPSNYLKSIVAIKLYFFKQRLYRMITNNPIPVPTEDPEFIFA